MTKETMERLLWLSLLELPWSEARLAIRDELERLGMTHDDLLVALRRADFRVARSTLGAWLRGEGRGPAHDGLRAIVSALAAAGVPDSAKGRWLSPHVPPYVFRPALPDLGETESDPPYHRYPNPGSQVPAPKSWPKGLGPIPHRGDRVESSPAGLGVSAPRNHYVGGWAA